MPADALTLEADDVRDAHHWFWRLKNPNGITLQTHEVQLDLNAWQFQASLDLYRYLDQNTSEACPT